MRKCYISSVAILIILTVAAYAQNKESLSNNSNDVEYDVYYDFTPRSTGLNILFMFEKPVRVGLRINLPKTIPGKQEIHEIKFDPEPTKTFSQNGNDYAEFLVPVSRKTVRVNVHVRAKVFRYDLATAMKSNQKLIDDKENLAVYLQPERMIECNDVMIQQIAQSINGADQIKTVHNIYNFVISYLDVDVSKAKGVGAAQTAQAKKGKCIDYCDLFVALCRAKQIPARVVAGYQTHFSFSPKHSWVEVYLSEYGWVPFNPTQYKWKSDSDLDLEFYRMEPQFLYFTKIRNDKLLNYNYFYAFPYWNKKSVEKIRSVVESIEFTKPLHKKHDSRQEAEKRKTFNQSQS